MHRCLDRYVLTEPIASGAHGQVWRGRHLATETPVAVKVLLGTAERFEAEAAAVARLDHPHILPILDLGRLDTPLEGVAPADAPVLVMPWADGGTLARASLPPSSVRVIARQILEALAHAHARGVLHLDVKPANILLHDDDVLLADFSIASLDPTPDVIAGTPRYMAPEQLRGEPLSDATDRYALGCVIYRLLAGRPPFATRDRRELAKQHLTAVPPSLPNDVPPSLARWVFTLLDKAPWRRFDTDRAAWQALDEPSVDAPIEVSVESEEPSETLTMQGASLDFDDAPFSAPTGDPPVPTGHPAVDSGIRPSPPGLPDWREFPVPVRGRLDSVGSASIQLLRLRTLPTIGRIPERDTLWSALSATVQHPRLVIVHGPSGSGTSHLGRWLQTLAVELGVAQAVDLETEVAPGRRGVCWLDDPDRNTQGRVLAALGAAERGAVLYVLTMTSSPRRPLASLGPLIELGPLSAEDHAVFTSQVLGLDPPSMAALFRATSGMPGPTLDRIGQAVRQGALHEAGSRWTLDPTVQHDDSAAPIPEDPAQRLALEVAAAFDGAVSIDDWQAGCRVLGLDRPRRLLPLLEPLLQPLLRRTGGVLLVRPDVREALSRDSDVPARLVDETSLGSRAERGRWAIAAGRPLEGAHLLLDEVERRVRGRSPTLQPWLVAAGDALAASTDTPRSSGLRARLHYMQGRRQAIYRRFEPASQALDALRTLATASATIANRIDALEAHLLQCRGENRATVEHAERTLADPPDDPLLRVHLHFSAGYAAGALHDADRVHDHFVAAAEAARNAGLHEWEAGALADCTGWLGRLGDDRAEALAQRALRRADALGLDELSALGRINLAESALQRGDLEAAHDTFRSAERDLAALGSILALSARLLRLCVALEQGAPVRTRLTALRRVFEGFPTASVDLLRCRAAEALAAAREGEPSRAVSRAEEVARTLRDHPHLHLPALNALLAQLADAVAPHRPDLGWIGRPPPPTGRPA